MEKIKELMEEHAKKLTENFDYLIIEDISAIEDIDVSMLDVRLFKREYKDTYTVFLIFEKQTKILCGSTTIFCVKKKDMQMFKTWKKAGNKLFLHNLYDFCKSEICILIGYTKIKDKIPHRFTVIRVIIAFILSLIANKSITKFIEVQGVVCLPVGIGNMVDINKAGLEDFLGKTRKESMATLHLCKKCNMKQITDYYSYRNLGLVFYKDE